MAWDLSLMATEEEAAGEIGVASLGLGCLWSCWAGPLSCLSAVPQPTAQGCSGPVTDC